MRLQVEILRHTLPPVNIIFNTCSSQPTVKTISELLTALDKLVPLESGDGEWGLEDYIVEVAATSDQDNIYECLHYQLVKDVFKEDDEIIVRGLTTDEIRERRQGGRLQILSDGRHLFDGVAWGRRYNVNASRPGITIPPRKKRKLLTAEEDETDQDNQLVRINHLGVHAQVGTIIDEEEDDEYDEDAEEYEDEDDDESEIASSNDHTEEEAVIEGPLQIIARRDFDDADGGSASEDDDSASQDGEGIGVDDEEVQLLLKEAGELEEAYHSLSLEKRITSLPRKRKRVGSDQSRSATRHVTFEGFSTPVRHNGLHISDGERVEEELPEMMGDHVVSEPVDATASAIIENRGSPISTPVNGRPDVDNSLTTLARDSTSSEDDSTSSSAPSVSDSGSDGASDSDDASSDYESETPLAPVSSRSQPASDSDETSSSGGSESDSESESSFTPFPNQSVPKSVVASNKIDSEPTIMPRVDNPPGSGTKRTRVNNNRAKQRKRLAHLKAQGLLQPDADFEAMRVYERRQNLGQDTSMEEEEQDTEAISTSRAELSRKKEELLSKLNAVYKRDDAEEALEVEDRIMNDEHDNLQKEAELAKQLPEIASSQAAILPETKPSATPQKRMRLDVESSRRMLFSSLGLRNPKSPAAEQALREKLAKPTRNAQMRQQEQNQSGQPAMSRNDSWKDKLVISAIECVQEGLLLSPPPFPFKQHWERGTREKMQAHSSARDHEEQDIFDQSKVTDPNVHDRAHSGERVEDSQMDLTRRHNLDDFPYPRDIQALPSLSQSDVRLDTIIAYKQLQLGPKFEPEESPYRVGRITAIEGGLIDITLSVRDRGAPSDVAVDEETGERIYNKFEIPIDDYPEDAGLRETTFEDMINPKLVRAADVQVSSSDVDVRAAGSETQAKQDSAVIPESIPMSDSFDGENAQVAIDTPRRNEITSIIKGAGFTSALDEKLLKPIDMPKTHRALSWEGSDQGSKFGSRAQSPKANLWRSSPFEPDIEHSTSQANGGSSAVPGISSPPTVSIVETVDYPHVSQIDINQSGLIDPTASSSHQDAQRVSPVILDNDESDLFHLKIKPKGPVHEDSQVSLASEVPQSQPAGILAQVQNEVSRNGIDRAKSFSGDAAADNASDSASDLDSDGFPSLRTLTSSQRAKGSCISPPSLRRKKTVSSSSASPMPEVKISASQGLAPSLSQVPQDTTVVDLTVSSDPVGPPEEEAIEKENPRRRRAALRGSGRSDQRVARKATKGALTGLGGQSNAGGGTRRGKSLV